MKGTMTQQRVFRLTRSVAFILMLLAFCILAGAQNSGSFATTKISGTSYLMTSFKSNLYTSMRMSEASNPADIIAETNIPGSDQQSSVSTSQSEAHLLITYNNENKNIISVRVKCETASLITLQLLSSAGEKVFEQTKRFNAGENEVRIAIEKLNNGAYYIRLSKGSINILEKVLIQ